MKQDLIEKIKGGKRKMSETEAVEALTEATKAEAVRQVLKKTRKNVLLKLSRAVENITATHVKCNAGRTTLERVLLQNAEKLVGIDWQSAGKALEKVRSMRKWSDEKVKRLANSDNLHNFIKRQLTVLVKAWSIDIKKSATKAEMLLALDKYFFACKIGVTIKKQEETKMLSQEQIQEIAEKAAKEVVSDRWGARYKEVKELQEEVKECAEELARIAAKVVTDEDEGVVMEALVSTEKTQWWWHTRMSAEDYLKDRLKIEAEIKRDAERRYREDMENPTLNRLESLRKEAEVATDRKALDTISREVEKLADDIIEKLGHAYYTETVRRYYWKAHNAVARKIAALKNRKPQSIVEALEGRENVYDNF